MSNTIQQERAIEHARQQLGSVFVSPRRAFAIHYALQRLRRDEADVAPPVAAIAVRNIGTGQEHVFSIRGEAEAAGIDLSGTLPHAQLLQLEYSLLFKLNDFLAGNRNCRFLHWYMRDERFGFQALETRFRRSLAELSEAIHGTRNLGSAAAFGFGGRQAPYPVHVELADRIDLADVLRHLIRLGSVSLRDLAQANSLPLQGMMEGVQEPAAFASGNHAHLESSSTTKARLIAQLAALANAGRLQGTSSKPGRRDGQGVRVFINYRREDTEAAANWLHELLSSQLGQDNVFIDTDDIPAGIDFEAFLGSQIDRCDVFLVMIGRGWAAAPDDKGNRRLMQERDFVRREIRAALARGIPVIPVLVEGTPMPDELQLPADLMPLRRRMAVELRSREFRQDAEALVRKIREAHRLGGGLTGARGLA